MAVLFEYRYLAAGLQEALRGRAEVVADTPYGTAAVQLVELVQPGVLVVGELLADGLLDHFLPDLLRHGPRILLVMDELDTQRCLHFLARGVAGVATTESALEDLAEVVIGSAAGGIYLPPELTGLVVAQWRSALRERAEPDPESRLTMRETEVFNAMVDGLSAKASARLLGVSTKTVEVHRTRVYAKLGVRNQAELVDRIRRRQNGGPL